MAKKKTSSRVRARDNQALVARKRGLNITEHQIQQFQPDKADVLLVEAFLAGKVRVDDISEFTTLPTSMVKERLLDPVRSAWVSKQMDLMLPSRLGMVLGALYARAVGSGDPSAAKLLLEQYGKLRKDDEVKKNLHVHMNVDYTNFTPDQLRRMAEQEARRLGLVLTDAKAVKEEPIDVQVVETKEEPRSTDNRAGERDSAGPDTAGQALDADPATVPAAAGGGEEDDAVECEPGRSSGDDEGDQRELRIDVE